MHGLIFETSIWLLAGSTRLPAWVVADHSVIYHAQPWHPSLDDPLIKDNASSFFATLLQFQDIHQAYEYAVITICVSILCISYVTIDTDQFRLVSLFIFLYILATASVEFNSTIWSWSSRPIGGQSLRTGVASAISDILHLNLWISLIALCIIIWIFTSIAICIISEKRARF